MKSFIIIVSFVVNSGCGTFMSISEHKKITEKRESEWMNSWNKLKDYSEKLEKSIESYESYLKNVSLLQEKNKLLLEELKLQNEENVLKIKSLNTVISKNLEKIDSLNQLIDALKKDILRKENEYISLEKSKRNFVCQSWDCFLTALNGSDFFWDKYASQAEDFLGKSPHRKLLEKERKRVLINWTKGYKQWRGIKRTYFDWVSGDRLKTFVAELGSTYNDSWNTTNDFRLSGQIRIEVRTKKDHEFFKQVNNGFWKIIAYVKIKKKPNKSCFIKDCKINWIITKVVKKIEFVPDIEQLGWNSRYRKKVFNSKQFSYIK